MSKLNISFLGIIPDLNRKYWSAAKKKNKLIDSTQQIGKKLDYVEKSLIPLKTITEIFPLDTAQKDWVAKAAKLKVQKSKYITPAMDALAGLAASIGAELSRKERGDEVGKLGAKHPLRQIQAFATIQQKRINDFVKTYEAQAIPLIKGGAIEGFYSDFKRNLPKEVSEKFKSQNFNITGGEVVVTFSLMDMGEDNPFLIQYFHDGLGEVFEEAVDEIADLLKEYEKRLKTFAGKGALLEKVLKNIKTEGQKEIDSVVARLNNALPQEVDKLHQKMLKMRTSYKVYKKKVAIKIAKTSFDVLSSATGTGLSIAATATGAASAVGIAGLVLSCRSLFKSSADLGKTLADVSKSATKIGKEVQSSLKKQAEAFRNEAVSMAKKDAAKVIINNITDFAVGLTFTTTLSDLIEKCDTWMSKTYGVFEHCRKLAKPLNACLEAAVILEGNIKNDEIELKANPPSNEKQKKMVESGLKTSKKDLEELRKKLQALLDKISNKDFYSNLRNADKSMNQLKSLQQLRQKTVPESFDKAVAFIRIAADAIDTVAGAVLGGFDFASSEKAAADITSLVLGSVDTLKGLGEAGKALKDN